MHLTVTFLGTGTSGGVPIIGCTCEVCSSTDARDKRLRSSILLQTQSTTVVIDTGPDFRYQMLRAGVQRLDAVVFTHAHKDHTAGLDDIRAFNFILGRPMDVWASAETEAQVRRDYAYAFSEPRYPGVPQIVFHRFAGERFTIGDIPFQPIRVTHAGLEVWGFRVGPFVYITDANAIAPAELEKIKGAECLVLNALRHDPHPSHFTLNEAIGLGRESGVPQVYLTHISHQLERFTNLDPYLPAGFALAYDGLQLNFDLPVASE
jgi:phosphoribosyl 1,2-cyclic phosphate phosphodiesterase